MSNIYQNMHYIFLILGSTSYCMQYINFMYMTYNFLNNWYIRLYTAKHIHFGKLCIRLHGINYRKIVGMDPKLHIFQLTRSDHNQIYRLCRKSGLRRFHRFDSNIPYQPNIDHKCMD